MNNQYSFIIITYNEEQHLPRLLQSISNLSAPLYIVDSGSTDTTVTIGKNFGAVIIEHPFINHPGQWDYALKNFDIQTPWVICLDADQIVTPELQEHLANFNDQNYQHINGIYFNRKNFFKGKWIKYGGYFPFYMLKMIRYGIGYSDLNENMDHRFIVPGNTLIWKDGYILEENLKENNISFWIDKHNRYSGLVAREEVERMALIRQQTVKAHYWGSPDERTAWLKQLWWRLPKYVRPLIYFLYRVIFRLGILDGRTGVIFHFLQGFWFRLIVDIKIDEIVNQPGIIKKSNTINRVNPLRFIVSFTVLFAIFYYFNLFYIGITTPGNYYNAFLGEHLNYISWLRHLLLNCSAQMLNWLKFPAITNEYDLLVAGHGIIQLVYSCLGLGVISFFSAFVISYPKKWPSKVIFLIGGVLGIELLNVCRFVLLALYWDKRNVTILDHHTLFNILIYIIIAVSLYLWINQEEKLPPIHASN